MAPKNTYHVRVWQEGNNAVPTQVVVTVEDAVGNHVALLTRLGAFVERELRQQGTR